jgi:hypothetical protein
MTPSWSAIFSTRQLRLYTAAAADTAIRWSFFVVRTDIINGIRCIEIIPDFIRIYCNHLTHQTLCFSLNYTYDNFDTNCLRQINTLFSKSLCKFASEFDIKKGKYQDQIRIKILEVRVVSIVRVKKA